MAKYLMSFVVPSESYVVDAEDGEEAKRKFRDYLIGHKYDVSLTEPEEMTEEQYTDYMDNYYIEPYMMGEIK